MSPHAGDARRTDGIGAKGRRADAAAASCWRRRSCLLSVIVGKQVGQFVDADAEEAGAGDFAVEAVPDGDGDVFRGWDARGKLGHFEVQVAVVVNRDDLALQDVLELLQIDDEAGDGIDLAGDGDLQRVVVAMPIAVGTFAEEARVLLCRPGSVPVVVGGGEFGFTSEKNHGYPSISSDT